MNESGAYSTRQWVRAVNSSAVLGWLSFYCIIAFESGFSLMPLVAIFGLPFAFVSCWAVVAPILFQVMKSPISWSRAMVWGGLISTIMASISILWGRLNGLRISKDPTFNSQIGGGEFIRSIDGILTPYGWMMLAKNTALFILLGIFISLLVRTIIGPGRKQG